MLTNGSHSEIASRPARAATRLRGLTPFGLLALALGAAGCSIINQELPNEPPEVQVSQIDTNRVSRGGVVNLQVQASDEDDDPLRFRWNSYGAGTLTDSTSATTQWIAPLQTSGLSTTYVITVTISDQQPDTEDVQQSFTIDVIQRPPGLTAPGDTTALFSDPAIVLEASGSDEDGDVLSFLWEVVEGVEITGGRVALCAGSSAVSR